MRSSALRVTERNYVAHNYLGLALVSQGEFDQAQVHYEESLNILPTYADAHTHQDENAHEDASTYEHPDPAP